MESVKGLEECWNTYIAATVPVSRAMTLSCRPPQSQWRGSELNLFFLFFFFLPLRAQQLFFHIFVLPQST